MQNYDIAAYIWPAYSGDEERNHIFWPEGYGEWQTVKAARPFFEGHKWPRKPLWGYVNEADPYVMEMEINAAADHGVNVFIYDWYWYDNRPFQEQCLDNGFLKARNNSRMKFYLMWANHTASTTWHKPTAEMHTKIWNGAVDNATFDFLCERTIEKYFSHPCYYKIDGKPVFMFYDVENLVPGLGGIKETLNAFERFRNKALKAGFPGLELQLTVHCDDFMKRMLDDKTNIRDFINMKPFDSVTHYQYCDITSMNMPYPEILERVKAEWAFLDETVKVPYYPHVSLGWDPNPRYNCLVNNICTENTPENITKAFELAIDYHKSHSLRAPLITVNSWNEWTEGSYLHPDDLYGYGYLEAIKKLFVK
ncbi:MAG: hypothetical protein E7583_08680 [Ruminococcaceae bacterium]|nr:hypothetical protein [Oscillospiraceae bacterium]